MSSLYSSPPAYRRLKTSIPKQVSNNETQKIFIQNTIQASLKTTKTKFVFKTNEKYNELATKMKNLKDNTFSSLKTFSKNMEKLSTNVSRLCTSLLPPNSTTKDANGSSEGGKDK